MAYPVLKFAVGGSDTQASGAGPTTAVYGSGGRTRTAANTTLFTRFGFFDEDPDISGVSATGSDVLFANIGIPTSGATSLRNFSKISAVYTGGVYGDSGIQCTVLLAAPTTLVVADTTGHAAGDLIRLTAGGAAGADLYTTIVSVNSGTNITIADAISTEMNPGSYDCPKQVELATGEGMNTRNTGNTASVAVTWAIGGKRATLTSGTTSRKLMNNNAGAGDAMGGWILEMESGFTDTNASTLSMARDGSSTLPGPVIRGVYGAAVMPIISWTATSGACFSVASGDQWTFANFEMRATSATKAGQIAITVGVTTQVLGMKIDHATDYFGVGLSGAGNNLYVNGCSLKNFSQTTPATPSVNHAIVCTSSDYITIVNNRIHNALGCGLTFGGSTMTAPTIAGNVISHCGRHAIYPTTTGSATANARGIRMWNNTLAYNTGDALRLDIDATSTAFWLGFYCFNNLFTHNTGYGINCTDTSPTVTAEIFAQAGGVKDVLYCNNFYSNTAGNIFPVALNTELAQPGGLAVDPQYTNASSYDFTPTNTALAGTSYPTNFVEAYPGAVQPTSDGGSTTGGFRTRGRG